MSSAVYADTGTFTLEPSKHDIDYMNSKPDISAKPEAWITDPRSGWCPALNILNLKAYEEPATP